MRSHAVYYASDCGRPQTRYILHCINCFCRTISVRHVNSGVPIGLSSFIMKETVWHMSPVQQVTCLLIFSLLFQTADVLSDRLHAVLNSKQMDASSCRAEKSLIVDLFLNHVITLGWLGIKIKQQCFTGFTFFRWMRHLLVSYSQREWMNEWTLFYEGSGEDSRSFNIQSSPMIANEMQKA